MQLPGHHVFSLGRRRAYAAGVRIAFGTDEQTSMTAGLIDRLRAQGHEVEEVAPRERWADVGRAVGRVVAEGDAAVGIVCCWTGTGVAMAANKVPGVRAALCTDAETALGARLWNDANVLALGLRLTSPDVAAEIVEAFLAAADPDPGEADQIARLDP